MIGLIGAQGVGKTTLAKAYAAKFGAHYLDASVTKIIREAGYDPSAAGQYDFATRLVLQQIVLRGVDKLYAAAPIGMEVITDRTPLDMLGYTLCEAVGNAVPEHLWDTLDRYIANCFEVTNKRFSTVMLVQPGIPLQAGRDGKAVANRPFIEHLNAMYLGFVSDQRLRIGNFYLHRGKLDLDERVEALQGAVQRTIQMQHQSLVMHVQGGGLIH